MSVREIWKPIEGYEGIYDVSNLGRVRARKRKSIRRFDGRISTLPEVILKGGHCGSGKLYKSVSLWKNYRSTTFLVHRLVAEAFLPKEEGKEYINHIDSDPSNNRVENLEWCTQSHNIQYAYDNGRKIGPHMVDVDQLTLDGEYVRTWHGLAPIKKELGIQNANIWKVCNGLREQAGGYKWQYSKR